MVLICETKCSRSTNCYMTEEGESGCVCAHTLNCPWLLGRQSRSHPGDTPAELHTSLNKMRKHLEQNYETISKQAPPGKYKFRTAACQLGDKQARRTLPSGFCRLRIAGNVCARAWFFGDKSSANWQQHEEPQVAYIGFMVVFTFREMGCLFRESDGVPPFFMDECGATAALKSPTHPSGVKKIVRVQVRPTLGAACQIWARFWDSGVGGVFLSDITFRRWFAGQKNKCLDVCARAAVSEFRPAYKHQINEEQSLSIKKKNQHDAQTAPAQEVKS